MRTSYSWHHKTDQKRKCNQSLHDMVVAPFLPRASRSLEGTVAGLRKARGFCSSPGQHCTRAGNGRGYAIASFIDVNKSFWRHTNTVGIQVPRNHLQTKLSTIAKTTVLSARRLKPQALKGQGRHRLTWRRLCLPCQASAIYEFVLSQDLWWHFDPEQSPTP